MTISGGCNPPCNPLKTGCNPPCKSGCKPPYEPPATPPALRHPHTPSGAFAAPSEGRDAAKARCFGF